MTRPGIEPRSPGPLAKCILNCLLFNVRGVLFHFFRAIVKFCVVFVVGII